MFLHLQASGDEREASATGWTLGKTGGVTRGGRARTTVQALVFSGPNPVARDSRSALASCFAKCKTITPVLHAPGKLPGNSKAVSKSQKIKLLLEREILNVQYL